MAALTETAAYDAEPARPCRSKIVERYAGAAHATDRSTVTSYRRRARCTPARDRQLAAAWMLQGSLYHLGPSNADEASLDRLAQALTGIVWHAVYPDLGGAR